MGFQLPKICLRPENAPLKINMVEEASLEFRLRKIDGTRNYLSDEIKHIDLMSEKYKKTCKYLNHVEHLLCICFISLCSCWYYECCIWNRILRNHGRNKKIYNSKIKKKKKSMIK